VQDSLGTISTRRGDALRRFYEHRAFRPAWYDDGRWHDAADSLTAVLRRADRHGLVPADYGAAALAQSLSDTTAAALAPSALARLDVRLTAAAIDYATDLFNGRIAPEAVDPDWYLRDDTTDVGTMLTDALARDSVPGALRRMAPRHPGYQRLQDALGTYRTLADAGGWPTVPAGDVLHPGDTSARVPVLRERLAMTNDLPAPDALERDSAYDAALARAVHHFQQRHGLTTDSLLGPSTRAALNVPATERARQIALNMERWRWLPDDLGRRHVLVNIPAFRLKAYRDGDLALRMDVVAGAAYQSRETPIFADTMEYVIFRPFWNIPPGIANGEILPKARGNRDYLVDNNYQIVSHYGPGAEVYDPYATSLDRVASGELRLREKAGPTNALGLVKFMFPNEYAVYLHDTPADHLFSKVERDFSHGCVRVERPEDLAVFVLSEKDDWTRDRIRRAMHQGSWQQVDLDAPIPVYLAYWTAFVDPDGTVNFRQDVYDHDGALDRALRQSAPDQNT
jgi:murein L,D-transpeptidase YcbB/YkuD